MCHRPHPNDIIAAAKLLLCHSVKCVVYFPEYVLLAIEDYFCVYIYFFRVALLC